MSGGVIRNYNPTRYGPSIPFAGLSGISGREVRAFGHPRYNDPDSVSGEFVEVEEMNYEDSNRDRENRVNNTPPSIGPASLREKVKDVITKGPSTVKKMYFGRGKKNKTRRTNKKRKLEDIKKQLVNHDVHKLLYKLIQKYYVELIYKNGKRRQILFEGT